MGKEFREFIRNFFRKDVTVRAIKVAFFVAPILILINHFDTIVSLRFTLAFFLKSFLTFLVPYCVSAYSSAKASLILEQNKKVFIRK
ncbi:MAG: hypothetical protein KatS3mg078_2158 [Deltaproteobacteria bacterium]|jgi:hypothetical protein|nr:MAG: hypothetical protein KatS3mg078_2158 [Deltaproteobacteria bacterium]